MSTPGFDATAFKAQQKQNWNHLSSGWDRWYDLFETGAAPVNRILLERAGIDEGRRVLDIGSGTGQPALHVAEAVGPKGSVVGVDQAGDMLKIARRRAADLDLANTAFVEQDVEAFGGEDSSFDAVVSRFTLMFLPDLGAVLRTAHRLLRPGGALAASVWGSPPRVPILSQAFGIVASRLELPPPPPGLPGPFSLADPDALAERLRAAGFSKVSHEECRLVFTPASAEEFATFSWDLLPGWLRGRLKAKTGSDRDPATWDAIVGAAREFETDDGLRIPALGHCVTAIKSH